MFLAKYMAEGVHAQIVQNNDVLVVGYLDKTCNSAQDVMELYQRDSGLFKPFSLYTAKLARKQPGVYAWGVVFEFEGRHYGTLFSCLEGEFRPYELTSHPVIVRRSLEED